MWYYNTPPHPHPLGHARPTMTHTPVVFFRTRVGPAALTGLHGVTGATAETTTYDRIFSTMKAMQAIMVNRNLNDPSKVTATMLAAAFEKVMNVT